MVVLKDQLATAEAALVKLGWLLASGRSAEQVRALMATDLRGEITAHRTERFSLLYTPIWIGAFAAIVGLGLYEDFDETSYMVVCVGLALPFVLGPPDLPIERERWPRRRVSEMPGAVNR